MSAPGRTFFVPVGINLEFVVKDGHWDQRNDFANAVSNDILSGDSQSAAEIVPMPKYDEAQENYRSSLGTSISVLLVPQTTKDVVPKYYVSAKSARCSKNTKPSTEHYFTIHIIFSRKNNSNADRFQPNPNPALPFFAGENNA